MSAPNITPADVEAAISTEHFVSALDAIDGEGAWHGISDEQFQTAIAALQMLTICVLVLKNGHTVTGEACCADPAKFNAETGRIEARKAAINKLWPMVVYAERERLAAPPSIPLTPHEIQSGSTRVRWAEGLIRQLPKDHDGRNSWLLNYGSDAEARQAEWAKRNPNSSLVRPGGRP